MESPPQPPGNSPGDAARASGRFRPPAAISPNSSAPSTRSLGRIMYAANFYVALGDREDGAVRFVYFVDEVDAAPDPAEEITLAVARPVAHRLGDAASPQPGDDGRRAQRARPRRQRLGPGQHRRTLDGLPAARPAAPGAGRDRDPELLAAAHLQRRGPGAVRADRQPRLERAARPAKHGPARARGARAHRDAGAAQRGLAGSAVRTGAPGKAGLAGTAGGRRRARNQHAAGHLRHRHQPPGAGAQAHARRARSRRDDRGQPARNSSTSSTSRCAS